MIFGAKVKIKEKICFVQNLSESKCDCPSLHVLGYYGFKVYDRAESMWYWRLFHPVTPASSRETSKRISANWHNQFPWVATHFYLPLLGWGIGSMKYISRWSYAARRARSQAVPWRGQHPIVMPWNPKDLPSVLKTPMGTGSSEISNYHHITSGYVSVYYKFLNHIDLSLMPMFH